VVLKLKIILLIFLIALLSSCSKNKNLVEKEYASYLDHENRINISLPYSENDEPIGMIPMGETVFHPVIGHPGIDFGWDHKPDILASADGIIYDLPPSGKANGEIGLLLQSGNYIFEYGSLAEYAPNIKIGASVKKGDVLGWPVPKDGNNYAIHWDISVGFKYGERLCPLTYLDNESRQRLESLWKKAIYDHRSEFPAICNGKWANMNSFKDVLDYLNSPQSQIDAEASKRYKESENSKV
jgi:hypothetical protein